MPFKSSNVHVDQEGRYVIVSGLLQNEMVTLVNVYAPNSLQSKFFTSLCPKILQSIEGPLIIGGDFNSVCDPINVIEIKMHSILLSDHAAVSVTFFPPTNPCKSKQWRLNTSLLKNEKCTLLIKDHILDFFEINLNSVPSVATVWEAFKATCRGWLISFSSAENKKRREHDRLQCDAAKINESFKNYYSKLYSTKNNLKEEALDSFFGGFNLPSVSLADRSAMDAPQLHRRLNIEGLSLPSFPIWSNPCLSAGGGTLSNNIWQKAGITTIGQIYRDQTLPFQHLKNQYGLSDSSFLSYAQIASIISTKCKEGAMPASCMEEDQRLKKAIISSGVVSNIYKLLSRAAPNTYSPVQLSWEHDLNISVCFAMELHLEHTSPLLQNQRWTINTETYAGMNVQARRYIVAPTLGMPLWSEVISLMSESLKVNFPTCPIACLLGHKPDGNVARTADRLWTLGCLATKRLVLLNWKERKPACFTRDSWLREYLDLLNMERAASLLGDFEGRQDHGSLSAALLSDPVNMASPVQQAVQALIDQHQQIPGNILRALLERFHSKHKEH
ncbi:hypothetical protein F7725_012143 [Dissostichus mawsoni]|uniref:Endonuclease/exonuclease/phosphatase domain-containing protein n=1 Tax=Dissostichus mawsoni TaxID=36200 RepID=A0A7J5ZAW1_DISMA|nr:hypothetical protein F7725_012143 [Dissostichus mawsoni]